MAEFAPNFTRNLKDYIQFPKDVTEWRRHFQQEKKGHPAPMNLYLIQELVRCYTKPGDRILDPMAGSGTLGWAALEGRDVVLMELSALYYRTILRNIGAILNSPDCTGKIATLYGDCRLYLPLPVDHVIFSPPYSNIRGQKSKLEEDIHEGTEEYKATPDEQSLNVGNLSKFMYNQAMRIIYKKLGESIKPGGTLSIIIQDFVVKGVIQHIGKDAVRMCVDSGVFTLEDWHRRDAPLTFMRRLTQEQNPGQPEIDCEDIIVLRRT